MKIETLARANEEKGLVVMKMCQPHWDALRKAVADRGMGHLGAKSGAEAIVHMVTEIEGRAAENDYDPLMSCHNMIMSAAVGIVGLDLMKPPGPNCPVCMVMDAARAAQEREFINGPADAALAECKKLGLIQ
jgi:hypothetical protein